MSTNVDANGRSILHKGHGMTHTAAPPDVCKTPSPGGPVPIPYVNVAMDSDITDGAETVKIEGNPLANVGAKISTSTGDEAGSAGGGILSSKIKGTVTWKMGSLDVKAEGKSVVRFMDTGFHNGNSFNTSFIAVGGTGVAYGDDFEDPCPICQKSADEHKILEKAKPPLSTAELCAKIVKELKEEFDKAALGDKQKFAKMQTSGRIWFGGYMVGVMICKEHEKKFAAMSGIKSLSGFIDVAKANGCEVVSDGTVGPVQLDSANTSGVQPPPPAISRLDLIQKKFAATVAKFEAGKRLDALAKKENKYAKSTNPYSMPGTCAGAHLIARSGHAPAWMTEMYFAPNGNWDKKYNWRVEGIPMSNRVFGTNVHPFTPWGNSVASCQSCQDLLYLAMCPVRKC